MEAIPQPVDTNRLKAILSASKKVMKKVESGDFEIGFIDPNALTEDTIGAMSYNPSAQPVIDYSNIDYAEKVSNSRLPAAIKEAMLKNPIPQTNINHTFNIEDMGDLVEKPMGLPRVPKTTQKRQVIESITPAYNTAISKEDLAEMVNELVNEKLLEFFVQSHNKRIVDEAVKKTINVLIKEGKLKKTI